VPAGEAGGTTAGYVTAGYGMSVQHAHFIREAMVKVDDAEWRGFTSVWQAESRLAREATVRPAAFLTQRKHIKVARGCQQLDPRCGAKVAEYVATSCASPIPKPLGPMSAS
jgi:hypothetical protein